ncbi:hypothetical protein IW262DRAFT_1342179 [Armillaria fumosa]|nr:hypothetical protein IW262DRAFT_1342179 [Armillaria fumosa]
MPAYSNARVIRDIKARNGVRVNELARRAYLYVSRNQSLSAQVRHQAQLQLNTFGKYTRPSTVKNRCYETGRGRGIMSEFALCRFQFRQQALAGNLNGVKKASW